jgi:hypothetical protein
VEVEEGGDTAFGLEPADHTIHRTVISSEEGGDTAFGLEPGLIEVEIHAVDTLDLQSHVVLEDVGDGTW